MKFKDLKPLLRSSDPDDVRMLCVLLLHQEDLRKLLAMSQARWLYKQLWSRLSRGYFYYPSGSGHMLGKGVSQKTWYEIYPTARMPYFERLKKLCKLIVYGEEAYYADDLLEGSG